MHALPYPLNYVHTYVRSSLISSQSNYTSDSVQSEGPCNGESSDSSAQQRSSTINSELIEDEELIIEDEELSELNCDDETIQDKMFDPIYEHADITVCGAYCVLMEFKRACRVPFTTIAKLLNLLQLLCPSNNNLPKSVYFLKKFFKKFSSSYDRRCFCRICHTEFRKDQKERFLLSECLLQLTSFIF